MRIWARSIVVVALFLIAAAAYVALFYRMGIGLRVLTGAAVTWAFLMCAGYFWPAPTRPPVQTRVGSGVIVTIAIILVAGTILKGLDLLELKQFPRGEAPAVGFAPPERAPAKPGRGFALGMGIEVRSCDKPVKVTLVAAGTAEYWLDNLENFRTHRRVGSFHLGIPGTDLGNLRYGMGAFTNGVTNPIDETLRPARGWKHTTTHDMTVISGDIPYRRDVVATFDAETFDAKQNWLEERGQGSCYLRLPALSGNFTAFATEEAAGRASESADRLFAPRGAAIQQSERNHLWAVYRPREEIVHGNDTVVATSRGTVLVNDSVPQADAVVEGDQTWTCVSNPRGRKPIKGLENLELHEARNAFPFSESRLEKEVASNCSGFAVVADRNASERRDVTFLLMGIGIALGLGLFIELLMLWMRGAGPKDPARART